MDWIRKSINFTPEEFSKLEDMRGTTPRATFVKGVIFNNHSNTNNKIMVKRIQEDVKDLKDIIHEYNPKFNFLLNLIEAEKLGYTEKISKEELDKLEGLDYW